METFGSAPHRDLESQVHRETREQTEAAEVKAALERTLSPEERAAFDAAVAPGISYEERMERIAAFNSMRPGTPDEEEPLAEREHSQVPMNFGGTEFLVSRDRRGAFELTLRP